MLNKRVRYLPFYFRKVGVFVNRKNFLIIVGILLLTVLHAMFYKNNDDKFRVANAPVLSSGMVPVIYDGNNWIKVDSKNTDYKWYNY